MTRSRLLLILLVALVLGGGASVLSVSYLSRVASAAPVAAPAAKVTVVAAARELEPGTVLRPEDLRLLEWPAELVPAELATSVEQVEGRTLLVTLRPGDPVFTQLVSQDHSGAGLVGLIRSGMRAVSVPVDNVIGVNGFVAPGTRVDVFATLEGDGAAEAMTRLVVQDVEILAAGHQLQANAEGTPQETSVVTLLVTPDDAGTLILALHRGRIQLALRNRMDQDATATQGARMSQLRGEGRPSAPRATPAPSAPSAPRTTGYTVEVLSGGKRSVQVFGGADGAGTSR
jgi:pilus assembly protein CpaB